MKRGAFVVLCSIGLAACGPISDGAGDPSQTNPPGFFDVGFDVPGVGTVSLPSNPCARDVVATVDALAADGAALGFHSGTDQQGQIIPWPRYLAIAENTFGLNNHFQSVVRLPNAPYVIVSGSNIDSGNAQAFIASIGSRPIRGRWGTNVTDTALPAPTDQIVRGLTLMTERWHAGGMSAMGSIVAIPIESDGSSDIQFWDFRDPTDPEEIGSLIARPDDQAAAVALHRLDDGRIVFIARDKQIVDVYVSRTPFLEDGFDSEDYVRWDSPSGLDGMNNAQNIDLVRDCDGPLYLVTSRNTSIAAPIVPGSDHIYVFEVELPDPEAGTSGGFELVLDKEVSCDSGFLCNLDAAGSAFVTDTHELIYYGGRHFRAETTPGQTVTWMAEFTGP